MAQELINFGSYPNDANADPVRVAFNKVQNNLTELYTASVSENVKTVTVGAGLSQDVTTGNVRIAANIPSITIQTGNSLIIGVGTPTSNTATIVSSSTPFKIDIANTITTSNVVAANLTGRIRTANQPSITSVGTLTNLNVAGAVTAPVYYGNVFSTFISSFAYSSPGANTQILFNDNGFMNANSKLTYDGVKLKVNGNLEVNNANLGNAVTANFYTGTLRTNAQPNITSVGNLTTLRVVGNLTSANANLGNVSRANFFIGDGSLLTSVNGANVTGYVPHANLANLSAESLYAEEAGNAQLVTGSIQPYIVRVGELETLTVTGPANMNDVILTGNILLDGYIVGEQAAFNGNLNVGNANLGLIARASFFFGDGNALTNLNGANINGNVRAAGTSYRSYVTTTGSGLHYIPFVDTVLGNLSLRSNAALSYSVATQELITTRLNVAQRISTGSLDTNGGEVRCGSITTGSPTLTGTVTGRWSLTEGSRFEASYADLAECYAADQPIEPGTVVEFGGTEEIRVCDSVMSSKVAGVVTTNPAYVMNSMIKCEFPVAIALQGRVPVKVTGVIYKGDMLVSAGNGLATAMTTPTLGSVIGKSLENFDGHQGIIEVAVGRL
jgi:hypothetical protein